MRENHVKADGFAVHPLRKCSSVVSLKFIEQFDVLEWFEQQSSGAEALVICGFTARLKSCPDTKPKNISLVDFRLTTPAFKRLVAYSEHGLEKRRLRFLMHHRGVHTTETGLG